MNKVANVELDTFRKEAESIYKNKVSFSKTEYRMSEIFLIVTRQEREIKKKVTGFYTDFDE